MDAAKKLRIPYWDWAIDPVDKEEGTMPYALRREREMVTRPDGKVEEVRSPLFEYVFHPVVREEFDAVCFAYHFPPLSFQDTDIDISYTMLTQLVARRLRLHPLAHHHPLPTRRPRPKRNKPQRRSEREDHGPATE